MVVVRSLTTCTSTAGGTAARSFGRASRIRPTTSTTLAPGCLNTTSATPRRPFCQAPSSRFSGASTASPTSRTRTGAPLR